MDTLSHALIGFAVASLSGQPFALDNPIYLAASIGAQAPDFDIISLLRGNMAFLRQHRSLSHSLPGAAMWALLISVCVQLFVPQVEITSLFCWALAGVLSHIAVDYLNTHGAAILWPLRKERKSLNLLNVFDPILLSMLLCLYIPGLSPKELSIASFAALIAYTALRYCLRLRSKNWLIQHFDQPISKATIMPSLKRIFFWDFVVDTNDSHYIGQIGALQPILNIYTDLPKKGLSQAAIAAQKTPLGTFFNTFTPFAYFEEQYAWNARTVNIYDLRYFFNHQFIHRATIIFNETDKPENSYLYSEGKTINVPC